jgi:hypothetical protein
MREGAAQGMERVKGIEPSYAAWEAAVLPLNYTRTPAEFCVSPDELPRVQTACTLCRQDADELIGLPQLLRQVERKIPEHRDLDRGVIDGELIE